MKDKSIKFVEELLRSQKSMKAERINLNIKWGILERQKDNAIEGQFLSAQTLSDMPGIPYGGYKETKLMLINSKEYDQIKDEQSFVTARLTDLDDVLCAIDTALATLSDIERQILHYVYAEELSCIQIADKVYLTAENSVSRIKTRSLEKLYEPLKMFEGVITIKSA